MGFKWSFNTFTTGKATGFINMDKTCISLLFGLGGMFGWGISDFLQISFLAPIFLGQRLSSLQLFAVLLIIIGVTLASLKLSDLKNKLEFSGISVSLFLKRRVGYQRLYS